MIVQMKRRLLCVSLFGPLALGCGDDGGGGTAPGSTSTSAATATFGADATTDGGVESADTTEGPPGPSAMPLPEPTAWELSWTWLDVGDGSKPAMDLDGGGGVHIAYMYEEIAGFVRHVRIPAGAAMAPTFTEVDGGYFYGPIDVGTLSDGTAVVAYHDHDIEDHVLAIDLGGGGFDLQPMGAAGHDGWYPAIFVDAVDVVHTATYDPSNFDGVGINYGVYSGSWTVETAVAGSFDYKNGLSIEVAGDGTVYVAYFDEIAGSAHMARRSPAGAWESRLVEDKGSSFDVGFFPQMRLAADGTTIHLVYLVRNSIDAGLVRYATGTYGDLSLYDVSLLDDLPVGMALGTARNPASIALDAAGVPIVAYENGTQLRVARIDLAAGTVQRNDTEEAPPGVTLGRQTAVEVGADGTLHLTHWRDDGAVPGTVRYGRATL